ncbi:MAG TPA: GNAT family N-acetyltransferase [Candidatus Limnocylindrales bacterium]|nr:GNAT family N-acetyltransferase [Candidatus Limnocylindrales bacterium]
MPETTLERDLRPATLDDAEIVADLETMRDPSEPRDPVLLRYWWQMGDELEQVMRRVRVRDAAATAFVGASHERWAEGEKHFGVVRPLLSYETWSDDDFAQLVEIGEDWLRGEGAVTAVARVREDFHREVAVLGRLGFREDRRMRTSELNLVARRNHILESLEETRRHMRRQGIRVHPLSQDDDPDRYRKLYVAMLESEQDIPRSVPWRELNYEEWRHYWFDNPAIREDRFWIAREGDDIIGTSVLDSPVVRGVPWTAYTGTLRRVRGRGIARALKYESMAQAIEAGYSRVRTNNDADNPPILRINAEMGYRLIAPVLELHRDLA